MRGKKPPESAEGAPAWMCSYADLSQLLLCFFILLFSFSAMDQEKFSKAIGSVNEALAGTKGLFKIQKSLTTQSPLPSGKAPMPSEAKGAGANVVKKPANPNKAMIQVSEADAKAMAKLKNEIEKQVEGEGAQQNVDLIIDERGLQISLKEQILFEKGKADLQPGVQPVLRIVGGNLQPTSYSIRVEGHTCNIPINTPQFPSNWELSTARAVAVSRFLIQDGQFPPERMSVAGYGEYKPRAPNTDEAGRALNRRVDIIVLYPNLTLQEPK